MFVLASFVLLLLKLPTHTHTHILLVEEASPGRRQDANTLGEDKDTVKISGSGGFDTRSFPFTLVHTGVASTGRSITRVSTSNKRDRHGIQGAQASGVKTGGSGNNGIVEHGE